MRAFLSGLILAAIVAAPGCAGDPEPFAEVRPAEAVIERESSPVTSGQQYCAEVCDATDSIFDYVLSAGYPLPQQGYDHSICVPGYESCWNQVTGGTPYAFSLVPDDFVVTTDEPGATRALYWGVQPAWAFPSSVAGASVRLNLRVPEGCRLKWVDVLADQGSSGAIDVLIDWRILEEGGFYSQGEVTTYSTSGYGWAGAQHYRVPSGYTVPAGGEVYLRVRGRHADQVLLGATYMYNCPGA